MQRNQVVTVKLTPTISAIFEDYERARPKQEDGSAMAASYAAVNQNNEEGLFANVAAKVTDAAIAGEMGAVGGQQGVAAAVVLTAAKTLVGHLYERANKDGTIQVFNLAYLNPEELAKLNDNRSIGSTAEESQSRLTTLKKLYHHACTYQKLKGSRFGFSFLGLTVGEHRSDNLIDDHKYLVNILIGRKLCLAAKARSKEEYDLHIKHLQHFLKAVAKRDDILQSKSNDTTYLSIRNVINMVNKYLVDQADKEAQAVDNYTLFQLLQQHITQTQHALTTLCQEVQNRTTRLICDTSPEEFRSIDLDQSYRSSLDIVQKLMSTKRYEHVLLHTLFNQQTVTGPQLTLLMNGLKQYANIASLRNENALKAAFEHTIKNKNRLTELLRALKQFNAFENLAKRDAFILLSKELTYLLQEIKKSQLSLIRSQKAFIDALAVNFSESKSPAFKNDFTRLAYDQLNIDQRPINEAIIALEQIMLNAEDMKAGVKLNLAQSGTKFDCQLPESVKQLSWYQTLFTDAKLRQENGKLTGQLSTLQRENRRLKDENASAQQAKSAAKEAKREAKTLIEEVSEQLANINQSQIATAKLKNKIANYQSTFNYFIADYINKNKASSIWNIFGHFHGYHGRDVAANLLIEFNKIMDEIKNNDELTTENLNKVVRERYQSLLQRSRNQLDGNFNPHSLKTYLYAYSEYLLEDTAHSDCHRSLNKHHTKLTRVNSNVIERLYRSRFLQNTQHDYNKSNEARRIPV